MKEINLENSHVYFNNYIKNSWRSDIKCYIENLQSGIKYYLTKECQTIHSQLQNVFYL